MKTIEQEAAEMEKVVNGSLKTAFIKGAKSESAKKYHQKELVDALSNLLQIITEEDEAFYNKHIEKFNQAIDAIKKATGEN
jgi:hypothetical protein